MTGPRTLPDEIVAAVRDAADLRSLIGQDVPLRRAGRLWKACCPLHGERTPSFTVYADHFHCYGCGAHGDAISYVRQRDGLDFPDAVRELARGAGITIPDEPPLDPAQTRERRERAARDRAARQARLTEQVATDHAAAVAEAHGVLAGTVALDDPAAGLGREYWHGTRAVPVAAHGVGDALRYAPAGRSVVAVATLPDGTVEMVQSIKVDRDGRNRTWAETGKSLKITRGTGAGGAVVRFPGDPARPLLLAEGPEDAGTGAAATGFEAWAALTSVTRIEPPAGRVCVVLADGDAPESQAAMRLDAWVERWRAEGRRIVIATTRDGDWQGKHDFNDLVRSEGPEQVRRRILTATLALSGLAPAVPPGPLPTGTLAQATAELHRYAREALIPAPEPHPGHDPEPAKQRLIGGGGGAGKTEAVVRNIPAVQVGEKAEGRPHRRVYLVPEHDKLGQQATNRLNRAGGDAYHFRGRGNAFNPGPKDPCTQPGLVRRALELGVPVQEGACMGKDGSVCPDFADCKFQKSRPQAAAADIVVASSAYLFTPMPEGITKDLAGIVIDEDPSVGGYYHPRASTMSFAPARLDADPVRRDGEPEERDTDKARGLFRLICAVETACADGYVPMEEIRTAGLTAEDIDIARELNDRRHVRIDLSPATSDADYRAMKTLSRVNREIDAMSAVLRAMAEVRRGGPNSAGRLELKTEVGREGSVRYFVGHMPRPIAGWAQDLPTIVISATANAETLADFFPRIEHRAPAPIAAPHVDTCFIPGPFGKESVVGSKRKQEELDTFIRLYSRGHAEAGVVTYKGHSDKLPKMPGLAVTWHGRVAGDDSMRNVGVLFSIGGTCLDPADLRVEAAARTGRPVPYQRPHRTVATALMHDGTGIEHPSFGYADPDLQRVHTEHYGGSIVQGSARGRDLQRTAADQLRRFVMASELPADIVTREVLPWADVRPILYDRMLLEGCVPASGRAAHELYPDWLPTERAGVEYRRRHGDPRGHLLWRLGHMRENRRWVHVRYQIAGQGRRPVEAYCPAGDAESWRTMIENRCGKVVIWETTPFYEPPAEVVHAPSQPILKTVCTTSLADLPPAVPVWLSDASGPVQRAERPPDG